MNEKDDIQLRNTIKEMIELKIKSNFAALALEYWCDYRSSKIRYYEELLAENKGLSKQLKSIDDYFNEPRELKQFKREVF